MISLFNTPNYIVSTSNYDHLLHGKVVGEFERAFADYVGAKYAAMANSASSLIFLAMKHLTELSKSGGTIKLPSIIPPVVPIAVLAAGVGVEFTDDIDWVGHRYTLYENIIDSAQEVTENIYPSYNNDDTVMIFSFYPTKPVAGIDGGMLVSNNKDIVDIIRTLAYNGASYSANSWERTYNVVGYKMHPNSIQAEIALESLRLLPNKHYGLDTLRDFYNYKLGYNNTSRHLYRIRVNDNTDFLEKMAENGIQCGIHYRCCHKFPAFLSEWQHLPISEREASQTISLPFHENIRSSEASKIVEQVERLGYIRV